MEWASSTANKICTAEWASSTVFQLIGTSIRYRFPAYWNEHQRPVSIQNRVDDEKTEKTVGKGKILPVAPPKPAPDKPSRRKNQGGYHIPLMYLATPRHQPDVDGATYIQPQQLQLISWSVVSNTWYDNNKMIVFNPSIESIPLMPNLREAGPRLRSNQGWTMPRQKCEK